MFRKLLIVALILLSAEAGVVLKKPLLDEIQSPPTDAVLIPENKTTLKKRTNNNQDQVTWIRSEQKLPKEILDTAEKSSIDLDVTSSLVLSSNLSDTEILNNNSIPDNFSDPRSANEESNAENFISSDNETNIASASQNSSATSSVDSDPTNDSIIDSIKSVLHDVLPSIDLNSSLFEDEPGTSSVGTPSKSENNTSDVKTSQINFNSSIDDKGNESELQSRSGDSIDNSQPVDDNVSIDEKTTIANEFVLLESHPDVNSIPLNFSSVEYVSSIKTDAFDTKARMISESDVSDDFVTLDSHQAVNSNKLTFSSVEYVTPIETDALDTKIKRSISEPDLTDITAVNSNKLASSSVEYVTPIETDASDTKIKRSIPKPDSTDITKSNSSIVNDTEIESDNIFSVVGTEMLKNAMEAFNLTDTSLTDHLIEENVVPNSEDEAKVDRKCPPPGICMFSFLSTDECSRDSDCLDSKICCRIRCSKVCVQEH